ncbi:MAG: ATP-binding protein, partial [Bacteroidales bacterium]|nr:ATP-binding protein [Bacteroidales bacterium]
MHSFLERVISSISLDKENSSMEERLVYYFYLINTVGVFISALLLLTLDITAKDSIVLIGISLFLLVCVVLTKRNILVGNYHYYLLFFFQFVFIYVFFLSSGSSGPIRYYFFIYVLVISILPLRKFILMFISFMILVSGALYLDYVFPGLASNPYLNEQALVYDGIQSFILISCIGGLFARMLVENYQKSQREAHIKRKEIEEKNMEIQQLMLRESQLNQQKLDLFANISHEFRTPLSLIEVPAEKMVKSKSIEERRKYYDIIKSSTRQLEELVNQIIEFRQLDTGSLQIKKDIINIITYLKKHTYLHQGLAELRKVQLIFTSVLDSLHISVDIKKIEQVLNQVITNAFKHTTDGGEIKITAEKHTKRNASDTLSLENEVNYLCISIFNTGQEIPNEHVKDIFSPFYQLPNTTMGMGLGLSMANEIVQVHNGYINVENKANLGTSFNIYLPIDESIDQNTNDDNQEMDIKPIP